MDTELTLSKMEDADYKTFFEWYKDSAYAPFFRHYPEGLTEEQLTMMNRLMGIAIKASTPKKNMIAMGYVMVYPKTQIADVSVIVDKHNRKQHVADNFTRRIVKYLFTEGTVTRIVMHPVDPDIVAALKRGGFFEECRMYKNSFYNGKLHNDSRMVLTKEFYQKLYPSQGV